MPRPLHVNVVELLRRPGTRRDITAPLTLDELDLRDDRLVDGSEVGVELHLESQSDGVIVEGTLTAAWHGECRRCLRPIEGDLAIGVHERYEVRPTDPDAFPIEGDHLDLVPMVREAVLLDLPASPLCSAACAGLCPVCGSDRNVDPCGCATEVVDDRWAALDALRGTLPDPDA